MLLNPGRDVQSVCGGRPPEKSGKGSMVVGSGITCYNVMPLPNGSIPDQGPTTGAGADAHLAIDSFWAHTVQ